MSAEYAAARETAVVIERTDRSLIRVYGRDPVRMIQGLVSNDVAGADASRAPYAAVLSPKGRMIADLRVIRQPEGELLLELDTAALPGMLAHLKKFLPPVFARFEECGTSVRVFGVYGPDAANMVSHASGASLPEAAPEDTLVRLDTGSQAVAVRTDYAGPGGWDLILDDVNATRVLERLAAAGVRQAGLETLEVLRIEAASPRWGAELTEETIPLEAGLRARAISETKGCYTGQEVIIRILHRGHVNRLLRGILLGDNAPPAAGTELVRPGETKAVARITSSCASPRYGETIGLGYVRREVEPPAELLLAGSDNRVRVVALPFDAAAQGEPAAGLLHATDGEPRN